jgi:tetratricopeptide (TPR) repeat protein
MHSPKAQAALLALIAFIAYANSLGGDFVYDDNRQILMNPMIQQPQLYGKALTSDVWAFKGDGTISASNYYRPIFVLWMIVNFWLFGANPVGWHVFNVALHIVVCLLSFSLLKRIGLPASISFFLTAIFAVHPVHVENISWISGAPDILLSALFVSSLLLFLKSGNEIRSVCFVLSLVLYAFALGTKEIAMLLFPLYFFLSRIDGLSHGRPQISTRHAITCTVPFAALAVVFFLARWYVIGGVTHPVEDAPSIKSSLLSVPKVFLFYLRQTVIPYFLAENYPLRPEPGISFSFAASTVASIAVVIFSWRLCRDRPIRWFGALLFILPLIPALFVHQFPSEQIVHDRYLYLSLLGFLIVLGSVVSDAIQISGNARRAAFITAVCVTVIFGGQTLVYNRVWASDFSLWEYNAKADPNSASSAAQFASELSTRGRFADAVTMYDRSLAIRHTPLALMGRARNLIGLGKYDEAIADVTKVIQLPNEDANAYVLYQAYETAAIAYTSSNRFEQAESLVRQGRDRLPIYRAALTDKLAIILYNQRKKDAALDELNSVRDQARRELLPASKAIFLRVGMLEAERGDTVAAKRDLTEYLNLSATFSDADSINLRKQSAAALSRLR